jgi:hypothetical protein
MSDESRTNAARRLRLTPRTILTALAVATIITVIVVPQTGVAGSEADVSSYDNSPYGARLFFELAGRLGWIVERREQPLSIMPDSTTVEVVMAPTEPVGATEVHRLLDGVRRGAGLLVVTNGSDALADSLHVGAGRAGLLTVEGGDRTCAGVPEAPGVPLWVGSRPIIQRLVWRAPPLSVPVIFGAIAAPAARVAGTTLESGAAAGFALGRGRVVAAVDPDLFRNDAIRVCGYGLDVVDVRLLEYLGAGGQRWRLVFDEYHHGFGVHPGSLRAIAAYLSGTGSGRMLGEVALAGLVLLLASAPRLIVPRDPERQARRSPLEHADALANAYQDVGASRSAVQWLVGGVRRRTERRFAAGARARDEREYLAAVAARAPELHGEVERVRRALDDATPDGALADVETALRTIEQVLMFS